MPIKTLLLGVALGLFSSASYAQQESIRVLLAPALETTLVSPITGQIGSVRVGLGDHFSEGDMLVSIKCDEQQARLQMAEAELSSARQSLQSKKRLQGLGQAGELEVAMAINEVAKHSARVNLQQIQVNYCSIAAPFDGSVVQVDVKAFQGVKQSEELLQIISDGPLKLRLNAPAQWVSWLDEGVLFEVRIEETGKSYSASVSAVNRRIDAVSQTVELEATIVEQSHGLLPGMSGVAVFSVPE